ncbi:MAG: anthranilate synthase component I [Candidatus Aureabacteria bacterium]|nr:anthranilate synthase component I [Candidatus Auribacterota bacterium]
MIKPDKKTVLEHLKKYNVVPVYKELLADFETPVSVFYKTSGKDYSFLLESVEGGENLGRFSFIGLKQYAILRANSSGVFLEKNGNVEKLNDSDPVKSISEYMQKFTPYDEKKLPRFYAGAVGYFGYDIVRYFEPVRIEEKERFIEDDIILMIPEVVIAFDHLRHSVLIIANIICENDSDDSSDSYDRAVEIIENTEKDFFNESKRPSLSLAFERDDDIAYRSNFEKDDFKKAVEKIKQYIYDGDAIQVVLSQCLTIDDKIDPFDFYRALRVVNPSPYMYYLNFGDQKIAGASPETLVRLENGKVTIRPIAGTRKRGCDEKEDAELAKELLNDEKERAEHIMLVDLARNDIGRVCEKGSIVVDELMSIEKYSHVMHIVSNVTGALKKEYSAFDLFRACFPAGTVSGAPKVRAMQIIEELEPAMRGPYAGSICYFNFNGNFDSAITIRTAYFKDSVCQVQAGAGIVADSIPEKEYEETLNKAKALLRAFVLAKGLNP